MIINTFSKSTYIFPAKYPAYTCPLSFFSCSANDLWIGVLCRGHSEGPQQPSVCLWLKTARLHCISLYAYPLSELQQMDTQSPSCAAFHTNCAKLCVCEALTMKNLLTSPHTHRFTNKMLLYTHQNRQIMRYKWHSCGTHARSLKGHCVVWRCEAGLDKIHHQPVWLVIPQ